MIQRTFRAVAVGPFLKLLLCRKWSWVSIFSHAHNLKTEVSMTLTHLQLHVNLLLDALASHSLIVISLVWICFSNRASISGFVFFLPVSTVFQILRSKMCRFREMLDHTLQEGHCLVLAARSVGLSSLWWELNSGSLAQWAWGVFCELSSAFVFLSLLAVWKGISERTAWGSCKAENSEPAPWIFFLWNVELRYVC